MGPIGAYKQHQQVKRETFGAMQRYNHMADADNWEIHHGPHDYFGNSSNSRVAKAPKGAAHSYSEASRVGKTYPLKTFSIHPSLDRTIKGAHIVDHYSKGNPHAQAAIGARRQQERFLQHSAKGRRA